MLKETDLFRIASKHCREKLITFRSDADDTTGPADRLIRMVSIARIRELVSACCPSEEANRLFADVHCADFEFTKPHGSAITLSYATELYTKTKGTI